jgi:YceI-like protein
MKNLRRISVISTFSFLVIVMLTLPILSSSQVKYRSEALTISIKGTSSLHDWEMKSDKGQLDAVLVLGNNFKITGISGLHFTVQSKSLKSGRSQMDNNSYKALKTNTYNSISFVLSSANIIQSDANSYQLKCLGNLTIAGTTHETELVVGCIINADKSYTCSGSKKLKMTDFNIKPPTVLMGTIKTGDEISVAYNLKIAK